MAAGKWKLYESAKEFIGDGSIDLDTHSFKMALFLSTSNCNTLSNSLLGDLTNQHANGNGYTTGGEAMTNVTWGQTSGTATFDADPVVWTAASGDIVARFAVIYDDTHASDALVAVCKLDAADADVTATDGNTLTVTPNASGIVALSGAATD